MTIITINRPPSWGAMSTGAALDLPAVLADPLLASGEAVPTPAATPTQTNPFGVDSGASGFRGYGTLAERDALTSLAIGDVFVTSDGINRDVYWRYNGTRWRVLQGSAVVWANDNLLGHTGASWAAQNVEVILPGTDIVIPAGLLVNDGDQLSISIVGAKAGTTSTEAAEFRVRIGSNSDGTLNTEIVSVTLDHNAGAGAKARQFRYHWIIRRESSTAITILPVSMTSASQSTYGIVNSSLDGQTPDSTSVTVPNLSSAGARLSFTVKQITDASTDEWWVIHRLRATLEQ